MNAVKHDLARFMSANERVVWGTENCPYKALPFIGCAASTGRGCARM
jgi:hypothetical protein